MIKPENCISFCELNTLKDSGIRNLRQICLQNPDMDIMLVFYGLTVEKPA